MVKGNMRRLAAVEATQSMEVLFATAERSCGYLPACLHQWLQRGSCLSCWE